jgi:hypothetical protein
MTESENKVSPAIEKHYKVVGVVPGAISVQGREYDLRTISLAEADQLHKLGRCPYLVKIGEAEPTALPKEKK